MRVIAALLISLAVLGAGETPLHIEVLDALARSGTPLRIRFVHDTPGRVAATLQEPDGRDLATAEADSGGIMILVLVPETVGDKPLTLRCSLRIPGPDALRPHLETTSVAVDTPASRLRPVLTAIAELRQRGERDPLPWLWAEQVSEIAAGSPSAQSVTRIQELGARITDWLSGVHPCDIAAIRDPVDDGVLPIRIHLPAGTGPFPVALLCLGTAGAARKAAWPDAPTAWIDAARLAGVAVVECYPAGDPRWCGAAARRLRINLAAAMRSGVIDPQRGAVVCPVEPTRAPFAVHPPDGDADPAWWQRILGPPLPSATSVWDERPFTIVVGTGEHRFARDGNRRLAESFRAAYAMQAHAIPPLVDDHTPLASLAGRNLVCVGNPRSHALLAEFMTQGLHLDAAWDHRVIRIGDDESLRSLQRPLLRLLPRPDTSDCAIMLLDGGIPEWGAGLPWDAGSDPRLTAPKAP